MQKLPPRFKTSAGGERVGDADDVAACQVQGQAGRGQQFVDVFVDLARRQGFIHGAVGVFACQYADVRQAFAIDVFHLFFHSAGALRCGSRQRGFHGNIVPGSCQLAGYATVQTRRRNGECGAGRRLFMWRRALRSNRRVWQSAQLFLPKLPAAVSS